MRLFKAGWRCSGGNAPSFPCPRQSERRASPNARTGFTAAKPRTLPCPKAATRQPGPATGAAAPPAALGTGTATRRRSGRAAPAPAPAPAPQPPVWERCGPGPPRRPALPAAARSPAPAAPAPGPALTSPGAWAPCSDWPAGIWRWPARSQPGRWTSPTPWRGPGAGGKEAGEGARSGSAGKRNPPGPGPAAAPRQEPTAASPALCFLYGLLTPLCALAGGCAGSALAGDANGFTLLFRELALPWGAGRG